MLTTSIRRIFLPLLFPFMLPTTAGTRDVIFLTTKSECEFPLPYCLSYNRLVLGHAGERFSAFHNEAL